MSLLIFASLVIGLAGAKDLPMDSHEVFVVQTAKEMHHRGDWIVPWFNGKPRLNKPPLSYWLTGLVAQATRSGSNIQSWHGRLISLLAGIGIVLCTFIAGNVLFGLRPAFLSSFMLLTTSGWFTYTHDARPDMVYAFFCSLSMTAFLVTINLSKNNKYACAVTCLIWISMALATLTKGPHMPLAYLAGMLIYLKIRKLPVNTMLNKLRPVTGIIIFIMIALPWWYLLDKNLGDSELGKSQLAGKLLTIEPGNLFDFYYFYRPLILLLPWVLLLPFSLMWIQKNGFTDGIRFALIMILVPALMLEMGPQKRWFYMLPSIMPMCLILGITMDGLIDTWFKKKWPVFITMICALSIALILVTKFTFNSNVSPGDLIIYDGTTLLLIMMVFLSITGFQLTPQSVFPTIFMVFFTFYLYLGITNNGWNVDRFQRKSLAQKTLTRSGPNTRFFSLNLDPSVYVYYTGKQIIPAKSLAEIDSLRYENSVILLLTPDMLDTLPAGYEIIGKVSSSEKVTDAAVYFPKI